MPLFLSGTAILFITPLNTSGCVLFSRFHPPHLKLETPSLRLKTLNLKGETPSLKGETPSLKGETLGLKLETPQLKPQTRHFKPHIFAQAKRTRIGQACKALTP